MAVNGQPEISFRSLNMLPWQPIFELIFVTSVPSGAAR